MTAPNLPMPLQALKRQLLRVETEHGVVAKQKKDDDAWLQDEA